MKYCKRFFAAAVVIVLVFSTAACGKKTEPSIVGSWKADSGTETTYVFNEDGTGELSMGDISTSFTYELSGDTVKINTEILKQKEEKEYKYTLDSDKLTLERNSEQVSYTRQ